MPPIQQKLIRFIALVILCYTSFNLYGQEDLSEIVDINLNQIQQNLLNAPVESSVEASVQTTLLTLPLPGNQTKTFSVQESPVLSDKLATAYPDIKSYILLDSENGQASGRMSVTPKGVNYTIFTESGVVFLENFKDETTNILHKIYYGDVKGADFDCGTIVENRLTSPFIPANSRFNTISTGDSLRTYRMAIASSGEFTAGNGGTTASVNAVFNEKLNQLNTIFEKELTIRFILANGNDNLIFFDTLTDGLDVDNRLSTAQTVITNNIASANYDIGHVFYEIPLCEMDETCLCNTGASSASGVASLNSVCQNFKSRGWTGATCNASDDLFMGVFAHEIGHQFGAHHSYYGTAGNCNQRSAGHGYEPGSGNSLMSYEGSCNSHNITPKVSTFYFHIHSIIEMLSHANGAGNCYTSTATGNTPPVVTAPADVTIPQGTPFTITGAGADANGDNLTYIWEQYDTDNSGGSAPNAAANSTTAPLFRSFDPSSSGNVRIFPQISDILNKTQTQGEILPQVARTMHFRLTARDNNASGGGLHCDEVAIAVDDSSVPFAVTLPTAANSYTADGSNMITVNWNVGATASAPISCATVDILLSPNGGNSFPITLATGVMNDGVESIILPAGLPNTTTARIKVACANGGVEFFNISDGDFSISSSCNAQTSFQCPTASITASEGDSNTNLTINALTGNTIISKSFNVATTDAKMDVITKDSVDNCINNNFQRHFGVLEFTVDQSGAYTFTEAISGFMILNLFQNSFDPTDPCPTWLASTVTDNDGNPSGGVSGSTSFNVSLTECTTYYLTVSQYGGNSNFAGDVNISGVGNVTELQAFTAGTGYTYIAINQAADTVAAQSTTADFTTLLGGATYEIYGVSYNNTETPSNWVGLSQNSLVDGTRCLLLSANATTLIVTPPPCSNPTPILGTTTNPTTCISLDGSIELTSLTASTNYILNYKKDNVSEPAMPITTDGSGNYTLANLDAGTYTEINITISNCISTNLMATLTESTGSTAAVISGNATICNGDSASISVAITGGMSPYTLIYNGETINGYVHNQVIFVNPSSNTNYTITSITDANGCVGTNNSGSADIIVNQGSTAAIMSGTATICSGESTNIAIAITGGTSPYTLVYSTAAGNTTVSNYTSGTLIPVSLSADSTYTIVSITDANGCVGVNNSGSADITVNEGSTAGIMSGTATICNGESTNIAIAITGGTSPYTLVYSTAAGNTTIPNYTSGTMIPVSPSADSAYAIVSITDTNGCDGTNNSGSADITVNQGSTAAIMSGTAIICNGESTDIVVAITGGTSPYTLVYSTAAGNTTIPNYMSGTMIPVSPSADSTYAIVSITDANGCIGTNNSGSADITVNEGSTASIMSGTATICNGESTDIVVAITGGTSPYTLVYSTAAGNTMVSNYTSGALIPVSPSADSTYAIVSITDANGCVGTNNSGNAVITVNEGSTAGIMSGTATICNGESTDIVVAITGGTSPYTLVYNTAAGNTTISNYMPGTMIPVSPSTDSTYVIVSITDANGCDGTNNSGSADITVNQGSTAAVMSGTATICNGESTDIVVAIKGGTSPYTLVYSTAAGNTTIPNYMSGTMIPVSPSADSTYAIVSITDANGCIGTNNSGSADITVNEGSTAGIMSGTATICNGESTDISVAITGGTSPYTLVYSTASGNTTIPNYMSGTMIPVSPSADSTYAIVSITDANGCVGTNNSGNADITVNEGSSAAIMSGTATINNGDSTTISVAITGGTSPYTLVYNTALGNTTISNYTSDTPIFVKPSNDATYTIVSVTDANGCIGTNNSGSAVITVNQGSTAAVMSGTATICNGDSTSISVAISGGISPYTLVYSTALGNTTIPNYISGAPIFVMPPNDSTYTIVSITDANGAISTTNSGSADITVNQGSTAAIMNGTAAICSGESTNIAVAITGGISPYTLVYSTAAGNTTVSNYTSGALISVSPSADSTYTIVSITDANGCVGTNNSGNAVITVNEGITNAFMSGITAICDGESADIFVGITGGTSPYTLEYSTPAGDMIVPNYISDMPISVTLAGEYTIVSVTDANGCIGTNNEGSVMLTVTQGSTAAVMSGSASINSGESTDISVAITGGISPYTLIYSTGLGNTTIDNYDSETPISVSPASDATYSIVSVTDFNGCVGMNNSGSAVITVNSNCPDTLDVPTVANNQIHQAASVLTSTATISANDTVTFLAGQSITLGVGFTAVANSIFTAAIVGCNPIQAILSESVTRKNTQNTTILTNTTMAIHPNPARDFVTIDYQLNEASRIAIGLFDITGKQLSRILPIQSQMKGNYQQQIQLADFNAGMYFIILQTDKEKISKKLIIVQ